MLGIILGGGAGTRLYPLTKKRAKPAVPLGANYRLIDIPVSNCLNSNISKIYCLTQFNSASLNRHLSQAYVSQWAPRGERQGLSEPTLGARRVQVPCSSSWGPFARGFRGGGKGVRSRPVLTPRHRSSAAGSAPLSCQHLRLCWHHGTHT